MTNASTSPGGPATSAPSLPAAVDRATFQAGLDRLRVREKAHTREGDAIAAAPDAGIDLATLTSEPEREGSVGPGSGPMLNPGG